MELHAIAGLPRSGSTLLCNLLAQNPRFFASSTSALAGMVAGLTEYWSTSPEVKSDLANDRAGTEMRLARTLKAVCDSWWGDRNDVVFDKGRGWLDARGPLRVAYPNATILCCVRDPRDVVASIQARDGEFPVLSNHRGPRWDSVPSMFMPDGVVGGPMRSIESAIKTRAQNVFVIVFEHFVRQPERTLRSIYEAIGELWWAGHDFENVENQSTDLDALYLHKFPHDGSGPVRPPDRHWSQTMTDGMAAEIMEAFPVFSQAFGYSNG